MYKRQAMVCALYGELDGQELAVEALRRIVQAELMGQFYKLKYFVGDLQREIRNPCLLYTSLLYGGYDSPCLSLLWTAYPHP